ncbi:MAG: hypothetical protein AMXMBFR7_38040 [Planctomycetota bacterium]
MAASVEPPRPLFESLPPIPWRQAYLSTCLALMVCMALLAPAFLAAFREDAPSFEKPPAYTGTFFLTGCFGLLALLAWRVDSAEAVGMAWGVVSVVLGYVGLFVPTGSVTVARGGGIPKGFTGFCGEGVPIPFVLWDDGRDYPNPMACILNPMFLFVAGMSLYAAYRATLWWFKKVRAGRIETTLKPPAPDPPSDRAPHAPSARSSPA